MRVLNVWVTAVIVIAILTICWYVSMDIVVTITHAALSDVTGQALSITVLINYVAAWWGPIFDVFVLLWAIINSQEVDPFGRHI